MFYFLLLLTYIFRIKKTRGQSVVSRSLPNFLKVEGRSSKRGVSVNPLIASYKIDISHYVTFIRGYKGEKLGPPFLANDANFKKFVRQHQKSNRPRSFFKTKIRVSSLQEKYETHRSEPPERSRTKTKKIVTVFLESLYGPTCGARCKVISEM